MDLISRRFQSPRFHSPQAAKTREGKWLFRGHLRVPDKKQGCASLLPAPLLSVPHTQI